MLSSNTSAVASDATTYVEDVFSTYLYTGNGSTQVVENNIALGDTLAGSCVSFNGVSDYLVRNSDLTGNSDGTTFTLSFWAFITNTYSTILRSDNGRVEVTIQPTQLTFDFKNTSGTSIWRGNTASGTCPKYTWLHVLISVNTSGSKKIYINDTDVTSGISYVADTTGTLDFTDTKFGIGAYADGSLPIAGKLTHFFLDKTYRDLSVSANRRLFITASGEPATGLESLNPILYLPLNDKVTVGANSGTGGDFTKVNSPTALSNGGPYTVAGTGKGGMVWIKGRSAASNNSLYDTARGAGTGSGSTTNKTLSSNLDSVQGLGLTTDYLSAFSATGFSVTQGGATTATRGTNYNGVTYSSWTFRKQPKFFDVVTWTGDGAATRTISHSLGSAPGCIIAKSSSLSGGAYGSWTVYHRGAGTGSLILNTTGAYNPGSSAWQNTAPTATEFYVDSNLNQNAATYVAYLFAHDAGGFGLTGTDNVISCGSVTDDGSGNGVFANLGWEPQWVLVKRSNGVENWAIADNMRGMAAVSVADNSNGLIPNTTGAEALTAATGRISATGWTSPTGRGSGEKFIYIAIRRGPMKVPTDATKVFTPATRTGDGATAVNVTNATFPVDLAIGRGRSTSAATPVWIDRLRGATVQLRSDNTDAEAASTIMSSLASQTGWIGSTGGSGSWNITSVNYIQWYMRRAPSFFDEVCFTGTGSAVTVNHNLQAVPELMIVKSRSVAEQWLIYHSALGNTKFLYFTTGTPTTSSLGWNNTSPTSTQLTVGAGWSGSGVTLVAYLFATCAGVSKVGSYTGTGTTKQIDCGFAAGARFVLIKRTDSTGDWYVWDTSRGIVSGNDPYLLLNSTAAEATSTDYIDTYSAGFELSSTAPAALNASGGTYIFLAIA